MKIGILTQPLWRNYGGILQNYALQQVLIRLGHNPVTIHYCRQTIKLGLLEWVKYFVKIIIGHPNRKYKAHKLGNIIKMRYDGVAPFCKKYIIETRPMKGIDATQKEFQTIGAYIVGSDQVWRPQYNWCNQFYHMYLDFVQEKHNVKKIAYAASFGVDFWEYSEEQTAKCKELIKQFDAVSVRETSGINLCRDYLGVETQQVLDPTLLLSADDYRSLIATKEYSCKGEVCVYILDMTQEKRRMIDAFCKKNNLQWYQIGAYLENGDVPSIESWIAGIDQAQYVITDSFHGSVFSIIFNKPFISIGNKDRGMSRFDSLLSLFGLEDRLVSLDDCLEKISTPDWAQVHSRLSQLQEESLNYLKKNLE